MTLDSDELMAALPVTISLGVASMLSNEVLKALVARADAALSWAKAGGRNRIAV